MSYAILHQVSGEYAGRFFDNRLSLNVGVRAPFLRRDLTNNCFTTSASGFVDCLANNSMNAAYAAAHPTYAVPQQRVIDYNRVLPNAGITFNFTPRVSMFANYSKGCRFRVRTACTTPSIIRRATPGKPRRNHRQLRRRRALSFGQDAGAGSGWYTLFQNRLASAYDQELGVTVYRNLGTVEKYGVDASVSWEPIKQLSLYAFGSYLKSRIVADVDAAPAART
jgi:iron complex outermembrane receptor protein